MPHSRITISYQDQPIRIYGLPDEPVFRYQDISAILTSKENVSVHFSLIPELEIFNIDINKEEVPVVNNAGIYKMIFNPRIEKNVSIHFERYFIEEVEPALRKYGYPAENKSC